MNIYMKIGLLPLYIKLYDDVCPQLRPRLEGFYKEISEQFEKRGIEVVESDFCRIKPEFEKAVLGFETEKVDAIVTLHMAYSPSLESIDALVKTKLPIVILDTTQTLEFTQMQDSDEINYCHGIHGVMDMCSMLKRRGKPYAIAAGHYLESDSIDRVCGFVRAAAAANTVKTMKVGLVGGGFDGMGDFAVDPKELKKRFGISVENVKPDILREIAETITENGILAETEENKQRFDFAGDIIEDEYKKAIKSCLVLRKLLEKEKYTAFSVNFLNIDGLSSMPFIECSKAMERGIGYAGEGDALTSAFTGALLSAYPETGFVEIFCPDWKNGTLFMSHMGEMNYSTAEGKPVITRAGANFTCGTNPYVGYARMKKGSGIYLNVSRDKDDYQLLLATCDMLSEGPDNFPGSMRGWMKPTGSTTAEFLENLSKNGATHHSSFVYGASVEELEFFGNLLSMKTVII